MTGNQVVFGIWHCPLLLVRTIFALQERWHPSIFFVRPLQPTEREQLIVYIRPHELQVPAKRDTVLHPPHMVVSRRRQTRCKRLSTLMVSTTPACLLLASPAWNGVVFFLKTLLTVQFARQFICSLKRGVQERNKCCLPILPSFATPITPT